MNLFNGLGTREGSRFDVADGISRHVPELHLKGERAGLSANQPEMWENYRLRMERYGCLCIEQMRGRCKTQDQIRDRGQD